MIFKPKFFLDLTGGKDEIPAAPALVAPVKEKAAPAKAQASKPIEVAVLVAPVAQPPPASEPAKAAGEAPAAVAAAAARTSLTTAESIAAELAAAQANRPAPSLATFAPEALVPGGANLAGFKAIARSFVKN